MTWKSRVDLQVLGGGVTWCTRVKISKYSGKCKKYVALKCQFFYGYVIVVIIQHTRTHSMTMWFFHFLDRCVCVCLLCLQVSFGPEAWRWPTTCRTSWEPNRNLSSDLETGSVVNMPEGEFKIWAKAAIYTFYLCHLERIFNGIKLRSCGNFVPTNFKLNLNTLNFLLWFTFCNQKIILERKCNCKEKIRFRWHWYNRIIVWCFFDILFCLKLNIKLKYLFRWLCFTTIFVAVPRPCSG